MRQRDSQEESFSKEHWLSWLSGHMEITKCAHGVCPSCACVCFWDIFFSERVRVGDERSKWNVTGIWASQRYRDTIKPLTQTLNETKTLESNTTDSDVWWNRQCVTVCWNRLCNTIWWKGVETCSNIWWDQDIVQYNKCRVKDVESCANRTAIKVISFRPYRRNKNWYFNFFKCLIVN